MTLRNYQQECVETVAAEFRNGTTKQLCVMPTGAGKTRTFASIPAAIGARRFLVISHREELVRHARDTIKETNPEINVGVEMARRRTRGVDPPRV